MLLAISFPIVTVARLQNVSTVMGDWRIQQSNGRSLLGRFQVPVTVIQAWAGHTDLSVTQRYMHAANCQQ